MNAKIRLTKLTAHKSQLNAPDGRTINVLIIPVALNKLEYIDENTIRLNFVCFEKQMNDTSPETHILKQDFTDEQKKTLTKDYTDSLPILGNLIDWEKSKSQQPTAKSIISGHINLRKLQGILRKYRLKNGEYTECVVINTDKNYLYHHDNGDLSLELVMFKIKTPKGSATHNIKLNVPKEVYDSMSEQERNEVPFLGSAKFRVIQPQANNDNELEKLMPTDLDHFQSLETDFPAEYHDDLPF